MNINTMTMRKKLVQEAKSWKKTRFHHQGRLKQNKNDKGGCDCVGLVIGSMKNVDFKIKGKNAEFYDVQGYSKIPKGDFLKEYIGSIFKEINLKEAKIGDLILFKFKQNPQHVAMIIKTENGIKLVTAICKHEALLSMIWMNYGKVV